MPTPIFSGPYHFWLDAGQSTGRAAGVRLVPLTLGVDLSNSSVEITFVDGRVGVPPLSIYRDALQIVWPTNTTPKLRIDLDGYFAQVPSPTAIGTGLEVAVYLRAVAADGRAAVERIVVNMLGANAAEGWARSSYYITGPLTYTSANTQDQLITTGVDSHGRGVPSGSKLYLGTNAQAQPTDEYDAHAAAVINATGALSPTYPALYCQSQQADGSRRVLLDTAVLTCHAPATNPPPTLLNHFRDYLGASSTIYAHPTNVTRYNAVQANKGMLALLTDSSTRYAVEGLPPGFQLDSATSGIITNQYSALNQRIAGQYEVTLRATNQYGTGQTKVVFVQHPTSGSSASPVITARDGKGQIGLPFDYRLTATNNPVAFYVAGLPPGLAYGATTGYVSGVPTQTGTFPVLLWVKTAGQYTDVRMVLFSITAPPIVTSQITSDNATGRVGTAFSYQITADNNPTQYGAERLPPGLAVNTSTGAISGTPTVPGASTVSLGAINGSNIASGYRVFTITSNVDLPVPNVVLTVDLLTGQVATEPALKFPHGNQIVAQVQFTPTAMAGSIISVGYSVKEPGALGFLQHGELLAVSDTSTPMPGSNGAGFILLPVTLANPRLDNSLSLFDRSGQPRTEVAYQLEVHWIWNGRRRTSQFADFVVTRDFRFVTFTADNFGGTAPSGTAAVGDYVFRRDLDAINGTSASLAQVVTQSLVTGVVFGFVVAEVETHFQLRSRAKPAGGTYTPNSTSIIQPIDYESNTNDRLWVRTQ